MQKVILKQMEIVHFKGVQSQKVEFTDYTEIIGDNGTGKSTINEAYMWCIFGKNSLGSVVSITPRDENNRIIPKVESSVKLIFDIDGIQYTICRKQKQNWRTNQDGIEVFSGYSQERFFNEVPCGVSELNKKLSEICSLEDWFMLSSVYAFMGMKQDVRRRLLIKLAGDIDEDAIMSSFPELKELVSKGNISIDDLQRQKRIALSKIDKDIDDIPTRIDELSKQIKDFDFSAIETEIKDSEEKILVIRKKIDSLEQQGSKKIVGELHDKIKSYKIELQDIEQSLKRERDKNEFEITSNIRKSETNIKLSRDVIEKKEKEINCTKEELAKHRDRFSEKKEEWCAKNEEEFNIEENLVCPTCKRPHDNNSIDYLNSIQELFYADKKKKLQSIKQEAQSIKDKIVSFEDFLMNLESEIHNEKRIIEEEESKLLELNKKLQSIPTVEHALLAHNERNKILELIDDIEKQLFKIQTSSDNEDLEKRIEYEEKTLNDYTSNLRLLQEQLYQRSVNANIEQRINTLKEESYKLAQARVDAKKTLSDIDLFKKKRIAIVEDKVSGLFEIVKWKMYEPNVSNDGEKEVCQALINGKPYEEQNTATKVNASVDIINGLSKALQITFPLFIDNKESVTNKISSNSQIIALSVVKGSKLSIN